jgi:large subunit ribosomal protein L25
MAQMYQLDAEMREILGKKVKRLRRQGIVPAVVYGPDFENLNIQLDARTLRQVLMQAGGTQLIELHVGDKAIPTLAREVQRNPLRGDIMHVDFYRVAMDRPIRADVPLMLVGESPLVATGEAILVHMTTSVEIEALPAQLPPHIEVDLSALMEMGQNISAGDLPLPTAVTLIGDPDELIVRLDYPQVEVVEEEITLEAAAEPEIIRERKAEEEEG